MLCSALLAVPWPPIHRHRRTESSSTKRWRGLRGSLDRGAGSTKADQQYEQEQGKLIAKQTQERQQLQEMQDADHQRTANASPAMEQKHQQQTQQLVQKHAAQQQSLQARQPQARSSGGGGKKRQDRFDSDAQMIG